MISIDNVHSLNNNSFYFSLLYLSGCERNRLERPNILTHNKLKGRWGATTRCQIPCPDSHICQTTGYSWASRLCSCHIDPVWPGMSAKSETELRKGEMARVCAVPTTLSMMSSTPGSVQFSSVHSSHSVMSNSLWLHELQHARPPCQSPTPGVHPNSCPSSWWCHPAISSSIVPFSCPQSLPASQSFPMSQLFAWGGESIGVSALASVLPKNTQDWSPLEWTGWISLQSKGLSRVFSTTTVQKHQFFGTQLSSQPNSHIHTWPLEKP